MSVTVPFTCLPNALYRQWEANISPLICSPILQVLGKNCHFSTSLIVTVLQLPLISLCPLQFYQFVMRSLSILFCKFLMPTLGKKNWFDFSCDSYFLARFRSAQGTKGKILGYLNLSIIIVYVFKFLWRLSRIISKLQLWKWSLAAVQNQVRTFDPSTAVSQTMFSSLLRILATVNMERLWSW